MECRIKRPAYTRNIELIESIKSADTKYLSKRFTSINKILRQ